jgi:carbon-monoxide dehydrogenase small subunit
MTITFILNGEDVTVDVEPNRRLIDILRADFMLYGAKCGCLSGVCGACAVIFNGSVSSACIIPAFRLRSSEVITIEGFALTNEYNDIVRGFKIHEVESCGFCDAAKILLSETLLAERELPQRENILSAFNSIRCRCTPGEAIVDAVIEAAEIRRRRRHERRN